MTENNMQKPKYPVLLTLALIVSFIRPVAEQLGPIDRNCDTCAATDDALG
jgi:hypothetical protein